MLKHDLSFVPQYTPDVLILEIGTNDLSICAPEVVGSTIDDLARLFRDKCNVRVDGVCQVINRNVAYFEITDHSFNAKAARLRQYFSVVLLDEPGIFLWEHRDFLCLIGRCSPRMACIATPKDSIVFAVTIEKQCCAH